METIIWKTIPYLYGYEVSNTGLVKAIVNNRGKALPEREHRLLRPTITQNGYLRFYICRNKTVVRLTLHRLVLEVFVGPCPQGMECRHLDGDKNNNHVENLRWGTREENSADKKKINLPKKVYTKLTPELVRQLRAEYIPRKMGVPTLARKYNLNSSHIIAVLQGKLWKHVE